MWICIVPYLEGNPIFIYDSNEKRGFQENLCQNILFRCAMSSIILNIYLNICCAGLMDMNIIQVFFFGCFFKTSINRFKYLSFVVWFTCTLAVYHYEHLICIQIGIVYKTNLYFFLWITVCGSIGYQRSEKHTMAESACDGFVSCVCCCFCCYPNPSIAKWRFVRSIHLYLLWRTEYLFINN